MIVNLFEKILLLVMLQMLLSA